MIFKNCYSILPYLKLWRLALRRFLSWNPAPLGMKCLRILWSCQMPDPSGPEAGKPLWRSRWTTNTTDSHYELPLNKDIYTCLINILKTILSFNSWVKITCCKNQDREDMANKHLQYERMKNLTILDFSKEYLYKF